MENDETWLTLAMSQKGELVTILKNVMTEVSNPERAQEYQRRLEQIFSLQEGELETRVIALTTEQRQAAREREDAMKAARLASRRSKFEQRLQESRVAIPNAVHVYNESGDIVKDLKEVKSRLTLSRRTGLKWGITAGKLLHHAKLDFEKYEKDHKAQFDYVLEQVGIHLKTAYFYINLYRLSVEYEGFCEVTLSLHELNTNKTFLPDILRADRRWRRRSIVGKH